MSSADTKAHKTGPARLLTDEDVSALEAFDEGLEAYFGKKIDNPVHYCNILLYNRLTL